MVNAARRWFRHQPDSSIKSGSPTRPLRILFVNQYYWPDHASTAQHLTDLAESLSAQGHDCHVLTSKSRYKPGEPPSPSFERHEAVSIHRVPATSLGRKGTLSRMTDYLSFYAGAILKALLIPRPDVVVTLTTPPIIGLIGTLLMILKGSKHVYWSMDLHPDASLALGRMKISHPVVRVLYELSSFVYRQAHRVVVLGPYMADRIADKGVPRDRIVSIPVWSRREEIYPIPRGTNALRKQLGLEDTFVAMYSGNLGLAHSFDEFLDAARRLRARADILFLFVGGGPRLAEVQQAKAEENLDNIRLLDYFPREHLHVSLSLADVHLISMRPEMAGIVAPGKLYGVMAAGRPALFVGPAHCETADTIRDAGCGITLNRHDVDGLVSAIELMAGDPSLVRRMGERGRLAFLAGFERRLCCERWNELMGELTGNVQPDQVATHSAWSKSSRPSRPAPLATGPHG